jgi:hypothetical protein
MQSLRFILFFSALITSLVAFGDDSQPDVYVIADVCHIDPAIRQFTGDFLKQVRQTNTKIDCVFFEWDTGGDAAIADYLDQKRTFEDAINGERARMRHLSGRGNMPMLDRYLLDAIREEKVGDGHVNAYAVNAVHGSKVRIEATEAEDIFESYSPSGLKDPFDRAPKKVIEEMIAKNIVARNGVMADNIEKHFQNGDCHGGIFVVGRAHVEEVDHGFPSVPTVQEFLHMKNRSVEVVHPNIYNQCLPH